MPDKANASKKKSQKLKRNPKRKIDDEEKELAEKESNFKNSISSQLPEQKEEIDKIVETTESMTGNIQSLKSKLQVLTSEVDEEEEKVKKIFQMDGSEVLSLPELSQNSLKAPILQKEILMLIPNQNALLKDLDVLHNSSQMKDMFTFIEEAYKRLDAS
ncbi:centromere protein Q-like [Choloepus didactylus]|uniref:centromere protein Q-like n=1 Tax=Choloepus didactylus TaxID=27675 RepID=UPI00189DA69E|nr:centromere protein Q-like [Choloepus didactylus]